VRWTTKLQLHNSTTTDAVLFNSKFYSKGGLQQRNSSLYSVECHSNDYRGSFHTQYLSEWTHLDFRVQSGFCFLATIFTLSLLKLQ